PDGAAHLRFVAVVARRAEPEMAGAGGDAGEMRLAIADPHQQAAVGVIADAKTVVFRISGAHVLALPGALDLVALRPREREVPGVGGMGDHARPLADVERDAAVDAPGPGRHFQNLA